MKTITAVLAAMLLSISVPPARAAMPPIPPDWTWTCAGEKVAKVWFRYDNGERNAPVVVLAGKNPCKAWIVIYWHNPDSSVLSRLMLAPGKKFNWDRAHIEANGADSPASGGFYVGRERNAGACASPSDSWRTWGFQKRVYSYKDVRPVPACK